MSRPIAVIMALFAFSLAVVALSSPAVSAQTDETELSEPSESQGCSTATGIVKFTLLEPPVICGDGVCTRAESCFSCSIDCCLNNPQQNLAGMMTGGTTTSISGLFLAGLMAAFLLIVNSKTVLKKEHA